MKQFNNETMNVLGAVVFSLVVGMVGFVRDARAANINFTVTAWVNPSTSIASKALNELNVFLNGERSGIFMRYRLDKNI